MQPLYHPHCREKFSAQKNQTKQQPLDAEIPAAPLPKSHSETAKTKKCQFLLPEQVLRLRTSYSFHYPSVYGKRTEMIIAFSALPPPLTAESSPSSGIQNHFPSFSSPKPPEHFTTTALDSSWWVNLFLKSSHSTPKGRADDRVNCYRGSYLFLLSTI